MKSQNSLMHHVSSRVGPEQPNTFHNLSSFGIPECVLFDGKLICYTWQPMHGQRQGLHKFGIAFTRNNHSLSKINRKRSSAWKCSLTETFIRVPKHDTEQPKNLSSSPLIPRSKCSLIKIWFYLFHSIIIITWQRK